MQPPTLETLRSLSHDADPEESPDLFQRILHLFNPAMIVPPTTRDYLRTHLSTWPSHISRRISAPYLFAILQAPDVLPPPLFNTLDVDHAIYSNPEPFVQAGFVQRIHNICAPESYLITPHYAHTLTHSRAFAQIQTLIWTKQRTPRVWNAPQPDPSWPLEPNAPLSSLETLHTEQMPTQVVHNLLQHPNLTHLKHLHLSYSASEPETLAHLQSTPLRTQLQSLSWSMANVGHHLAPFSEHPFTNLHTLSFPGGHVRSSLHWTAIFATFPNLHTLHVTALDTHRSAAKHFAQHLQSSTIRNLELCAVQLDLKTTQNLLAFGAFQHIKRLSFARANIHEESLHALAHTRALAHLEHLDLSDLYTPLPNLSDLFMDDPSLHLTSLSMARNTSTHTLLRDLQDLPIAHRLQRLNLYKTPLNPEELQALAKFRALHTLDVRHTGITTQDLQRLLRPHALPVLQRLYVSKSTLDMDVLMRDTRGRKTPIVWLS